MQTTFTKELNSYREDRVYQFLLPYFRRQTPSFVQSLAPKCICQLALWFLAGCQQLVRRLPLLWFTALLFVISAPVALFAQTGAGTQADVSGVNFTVTLYDPSNNVVGTIVVTP